MDTAELELHGQLREWARGMNTTAAATELLIRTGYARPGSLWMRRENPDRPWIDFESIPDLIGGYSGGQQRVLRIAASIAESVPIVLGDEISGLDHRLAELVLTALAQASGYGVPVSYAEMVGDENEVVRVTKPAILTWPGE